MSNPPVLAQQKLILAKQMLYSKTFTIAVHQTLAHEGYYSFDAADPGGLTIWGIITKTLKAMGQWGDFDEDGDVDVNDLRSIWKWFSREDCRALATYIYYKQWWERWGYDRIEDATMAARFLDLSVVLGQYQSTRCLQRAIRSVSGDIGPHISIDGVFGPKTLDAVNWANELDITANALLGAYQSECAGIFRLIAQKRPSMDVFLMGWLNRAYMNDWNDD